MAQLTRPHQRRNNEHPDQDRSRYHRRHAGIRENETLGFVVKAAVRWVGYHMLVVVVDVKERTKVVISKVFCHDDVDDSSSAPGTLAS